VGRPQGLPHHQLYNRRRELLDDRPGYGLAADITGALEQGAD
jgi:hypothetical protein